MVKTPIVESTLKSQSGNPVATVHDVFLMLKLSEDTYLNQTEADQKVFTEIASHFVDTESPLHIEGSASVLTEFNRINAKKNDFVMPLKDSTLLDIPSDGESGQYELQLGFKEAEHKHELFQGMTIYDGRTQFLDKAYKADKYVMNLVDNDQSSLAIKEIAEDQTALGDNEFKFRFVSPNYDDGPLEDSTWYLRAVVRKSTYKNYDNGPVLFLGLLAIDKYAAQQGQLFFVKYFHITDSKMRLELLTKADSVLSDNVHVQTGIIITNSEIADGSVNFDFTYRVTYKNTTVTLSDDSVFTINHGYNAATIASNIQNLDKLSAKTKDIRAAITAAKLYDPAKIGDIEQIFSPLMHSKSLPKNVKGKLSALHNAALTVNNTTSLLLLFKQIEQIGLDTNNEDYIWHIRGLLGQFVAKRSHMD